MSRYPGGLASPTIHQPFAEVAPTAAPLTAQRVGLMGETLLDLILAKVAIALGNVTVLGKKPFAWLSEWGYELQKKANDAFKKGTDALNAANWANAQLAVLTGGALASDVEGGVIISAQFNGASADDLGASFTLPFTDGPGAGEFGLSGLGQAVWKKSGGNTRRKIFISTTELATDYQSVICIISELPQETQPLGLDAVTYLIGRSDNDDTFVWASIALDKVQVGECVAGDFKDGPLQVFGSSEIELAVGDLIEFVVGTDADDCEFIVKQNGVVRLQETGTSAFGSGYRYVGIGARATPRNVFLTQTVPAQIEAWAAADRLPTTT